MRAPRLDGLERDVVARLDERQRGGGRRRESVGQQVEELAQVLAARAAKARRQVGNVPSGEIAGEPIEQLVADPPCRRWPASAAVRAPTTRSYSPRRSTRRRASAGACWPSASMIRTNSPCGAADAGLDRRAVALVVRDAAPPARRRCARAFTRLVARAIVDDEDLSPRALRRAGSRRRRRSRPLRSAPG